MRNKIIMGLFVFFLLVSVVSAEMTLWNDVIIDTNSNTVSHYGYHQFDDTSKTGIGRNKAIEVILWYVVEPLPYDLSVAGFNGSIDWCNLTITHNQNEYGTEFVAFEGFVGGDYINTTIVTESFYFENTNATNTSQLYYDLVDKDSLIFDMKCHYTNASSLFVDSILFGRVDTITGAFECDDCEEFSLEELSNEIERNEEIIIEETEVYNKVQSLVSFNYRIWLYVSWVIKIAFIFVALGLLFGGIRYIYLLFKDVENKI